MERSHSTKVALLIATGIKCWCFGSSDSMAQSAIVTLSPSPSQVGVHVSVIVSVTAGGAAAPLPCSGIQLDFGDGTVVGLGDLTPPPLTQTFTATHAYQADAAYTVRVTASPLTCPTSGLMASSGLIVSRTTGALSIRRLELRFANGRGEVTVGRDAMGLKAYAEIDYSGSGILEATWEVDGRVLSLVNRQLVYGGRVVFASPDVPPFPTFEPGLHQVMFRIGSSIPAPEPVTIFYFVETIREPVPIELLEPRDKAALTDRPTGFSWRELRGTGQYVFEIREEGREEVVISSFTTDPRYDLPTLFEGRLEIGKRYAWRVKAMASDGEVLGTSATRSFTWLGEPSGEAFVPRQVLVAFEATDCKSTRKVRRELERAFNLKTTQISALVSIGAVLILFGIPDGRLVSEVAARLSADDRVWLAQPNFLSATVAYPSSTPADGGTDPGMSGAQIAHSRVTGQGVAVAVLDTGVDASQPALHGRIVRKANYAEGEDGPEAHGTLIAGLIAGSFPQDDTRKGVAPGAQILAIRTCRPTAKGSVQATCTSEALARGLDLAIRERVQIIDLSFGGPPELLIERLVRVAIEHGISVVAAAGNNGPSGRPAYAATLEGVIAVTAIDDRGAPFPYAVQGSFLDLAAPGVEIDVILPGDAHGRHSGTSIAAAQVSGSIALLLQASPALGPEAVRATLERTARDLGAPGKDPVFGAGRVDACRVVKESIPDLDCPWPQGLGAAQDGARVVTPRAVGGS